MYINGEWVSCTNRLTVTNPSTNEVINEVALGETKDVEHAIQAADRAFESWSCTSINTRSDILYSIANIIERNKEKLAKMITSEVGKPLKDSYGEVESAINYFKFYAEETKRIYGEIIPSTFNDKKIIASKHPIGVVFAITPWNFPLSMIARKVAPALATGCSIIVKPSSKTPNTAILFTKIIEEIDIPKGVFNLVVTDSTLATEVVMNSEVVRKISFTGSTRIGKYLMQESAKTLKRTSMELGGHAPFIVFEDVDIKKTVDNLMLTKFRNSGQMCTATNRLYIQSSIKDEFFEEVKKSFKSLNYGDPMDQETDIGPVIDESAKKKILGQIEDAVNKGANIQELELPANDNLKGNFINPTLLFNVSEKMNIYQDETFGPVLPIIEFENDEDLMRKMNHRTYGLAAYINTNDINRVFKLTDKLEYGMVGVNDPLPFLVQAPFGGVKESGFGKEGGHQGLDAYLEEKMISIKYQ